MSRNNNESLLQQVNNCSSTLAAEDCSEIMTSSRVSYVVFCVTFIPLVFLAVSSNGFAFVVFYKKPVFRKILSNRLIMNLMTINIVSCLLLFPAVVLDLNPAAFAFLKENDILRVTFCSWSSFISSFVAHASILAMLTVGLDQYVAILDPLDYPNKFTGPISSQLIISVWCVSLIASGSSSLVLISGRGSWKSCDSVFINFLTPGQRLVMTVGSLIMFLIMIAALIFVYSKIFCAARKSSVRRRSSFVNVTENPMEYPGAQDYEEGIFHNGSLKPETSGIFPDSSPPSESEYSSNKTKCKHPKLAKLRKDDVFSLRISSPPSSCPPKRNGGIIKQNSNGGNGSGSLLRKCSFSSVNECRLVEGSKVRTILFSLNDTGSSLERQSTLSDENNSVFNEDTLSPNDGTLSEEKERTNPSQDIRETDELESKIDDQRSLKSNASILSRTSQAARRLSTSVSKGATNVYHFFMYNEERRTAKISSLVICLAVLSWSPYFLVILFSNFVSPFIRYVHVLSCVTGVLFASLSPFLYVYRSDKVRLCAKKILYSFFSCRTIESGSNTTSDMVHISAGKSTKRNRCNSCPDLVADEAR